MGEVARDMTVVVVVVVVATQNITRVANAAFPATARQYAPPQQAAEVVACSAGASL